MLEQIAHSARLNPFDVITLKATIYGAFFGQIT